MKAILSWTIVLALALLVITPFLTVLVNDIEIVIYLALFIGGISSVLLLIILIKERLKEREGEKDDLNKY